MSNESWESVLSDKKPLTWFMKISTCFAWAGHNCVSCGSYDAKNANFGMVINLCPIVHNWPLFLQNVGNNWILLNTVSFTGHSSVVICMTNHECDHNNAPFCCCWWHWYSGVAS